MNPYWSAIKHRIRRFKKPSKKQEGNYLRDVRGVVHVGANDGGERVKYMKYGLTVIWVEPIPWVFEKLQENLNGFENQIAYSYLLSDCSGKSYEMHIATNGGASSSIFPPEEFSKIWPQITFDQKITLNSVTFDEMVERHRLKLKRYELLVIDTQGAELLVLKGARWNLHKFKYVQLEVANFEIYKGIPLLDEVHRFMAQRGFVHHFIEEVSRCGENKAYFDIVYENGFYQQVQ